MYIPAHFAAADADVRALLDNHGAAVLVTATDDGLLATFLPFVFEPDVGRHGALLGHLARNNDEAKLKLSQNRPAADIQSVIDGLQRRGDQASAAAVDAARATAVDRVR